MVAHLGSEDARLVAEYFGATARGNFEGANILHLPRTIDVVAQRTGADIERIGEALDRARTVLVEARAERIPPGRDEKILTAWNGLMIRAYAEAAIILGRDDYRYRAELAAAFILSNLRPSGRLLRTYKDGQARLTGYLEDYAFFGRRAPRPLRGDLRAALAGRIARADAGDARPLLGRRTGRLL